MRIGVCVRTWGEVGGIGVYTRNVVRHLLDLDQKNDYLLFYQDRSHMGTFRNRENAREVYVPSFGKLKEIQTWVWDQIAIPYYARKHDVDVIFHTKMAIPLATKRKTVMVSHGSQRFVHPELFQKGDIWFFRNIYPHYLRRASLILAVSEVTRQDVIRYVGLDPQKVKTVHLATSPVFRVVSDNGFLENIRRTYHLPDRYILFVGHLDPNKNSATVFKALAQVRKETDVALVVAGTYRWSYKSALDLIPGLGLKEHVHFTGVVPHEDLVGFYNLAEIMVFPSIHESFGLPNLEAQACGCPIVISRTGGFPEVAGEGALYVDPKDESGLAEAILRVLRNPRLRADMIQRGFDNVKRFSWQKTARETLDGLELLATG